MRIPRQIKRDHRIDAKISELRELLISAKDLGEISDYFHEVLVPDEAFMAAGAPSSNPRLLTTLETVLERVAPEGKLGTLLLIRLQDQALCHGYTTWRRGHVVFFYFEQLDLGFCSYSSSLSSAEVSFLRFKLTNVTCVGTGSSWRCQRGSA